MFLQELQYVLIYLINTNSTKSYKMAQGTTYT